MGNVYMKKTDDVFLFIEKKIKTIQLKKEVDFSFEVIVVDNNSTDNTAKIANDLDGKATLVVGTHTHTPTLDFRVLENGTAYQTDAGMCGDYNSIIGMDRDKALQRFFKLERTERLTPSIQAGTISGVRVVC